MYLSVRKKNIYTHIEVRNNNNNNNKIEKTSESGMAEETDDEPIDAVSN